MSEFQEKPHREASPHMEEVPVTLDGAPVPVGIKKVEAAQAVWGPKSRWFLWIGIALACYVYSLDGSTTYQYIYYATSTVLEHSLSGTISSASAIIIAVGKPLMAKAADVIGRGETYIIVLFCYVIGYILIASANHINQIAAGQIIYSFGYTGLQLLTQIIIADMTTLKYRGLVSGLVSAPYIINAFVAGFVAQGVLPNWRWGYGMFAILVPVCLFPVIGALLWSQRKAAQRNLIHAARPPVSRAPWKAFKEGLIEFDLIGLILVALSLALIILPLGLAAGAKNGWKNGSMIAMLVVGIFLFPCFCVYEAYVPRNPIVPLRFLKNKTILGACLIGFFDFVSFYLQFTYQYSFVVVVKEWSYRDLSFFSSTQSLSLTIFGIAAGACMVFLKRYKALLIVGLLLRLFGVGLMIHARGANGPTAELVMCQVIQGLGGGIAATVIQVSAQASVTHADVATVTAMVLLITEIGNSVGSAIATAVWTTYMPGQLRAHIPVSAANSTVITELFGSITNIVAYPADSPIRVGAIAAYEEIMKRLVIAATVVAIFPPIFAFFLTQNLPLTNTQNAVDEKPLSGDVKGDEESQ